MKQGEEWRPVTGPVRGCEDRYEVSSEGRVRSLLRVRTRGRHILAPSLNKATGYLQVCLSTAASGQKTQAVHRLVAWAFAGPRPEELEVRHLDGDKLNNRTSNLAYGTRSENMLDQVRHGAHHWKNRTECPRGHRYTEDNTISVQGKWRRCKSCHRADFNRRVAERRAAGLTSRGTPRIHSEKRAYA